MPVRGAFIAVECVDGDLLEEVVALLYRRIRASDVPAEQTREPTRGPVGSLIRLARQGRLQFDPASLALLQVADRLDHLGCQDGILEWLDRGRTVLCGGYLLASLAAQWSTLSPDWLLQINSRCRAPDLTLLVQPVPRSPDEERLARCCVQAAGRLRAEGQAIAVVQQEGGAEGTAAACWRLLEGRLSRSIPTG